MRSKEEDIIYVEASAILLLRNGMLEQKELVMMVLTGKPGLLQAAAMVLTVCILVFQQLS